MKTCLYNGVELPALMDYDKSKYKYLYLTRKNNGKYFLSIHTAPARFRESLTSGSTKYYICVCADTDKWKTYRAENGQWVFNNESNREDYDCYISWTRRTSDSVVDTLIWTNTTVKYYSNSSRVYFYASEPVPLPETVSSLSPASMLLGWYTGRRLVPLIQGKQDP